MSELPINQPDEINTLLTEIVAERGPVADEERAHKERVVTILTNARTRSSAAIDAARAEARAQNNPNALSEQQPTADEVMAQGTKAIETKAHDSFNETTSIIVDAASTFTLVSRSIFRRQVGEFIDQDARNKFGKALNGMVGSIARGSYKTGFKDGQKFQNTQESADPADGLTEDERASVEIVRSRRRSKDALSDIIKSAQTREAQITPEGEN